MNDTVATVLAIGLLFVGLPILILALRDRRAPARRKTKSPIVGDRSHEGRLLEPEWRFVEETLQRPVPPALREMYADKALITRRDLAWTGDQTIGGFEPLDEQAIADATEWLGVEAVAIATTDSGDTIYLMPGADERDAVYLTHHDGGDTEVFADSIAVMLVRLRSA